MQVCKYAKWTGCSDCDHPFYAQCKKFLQVHARWLMRNVLKDKKDAFEYKKVKNIGRNDVLVSRDANLAKSAALQFALQKNAEVTAYTTAGAMDLCVNNTDEINAPVSYLVVTKATGASEAIIGMIESFCDIAVRNGGKVAVYVSKMCPYELKYPKAEEDKAK